MRRSVESHRQSDKISGGQSEQKLAPTALQLAAKGPVMQCNVGGAERGLRFLVGLVALAVALFVDVSDGWRIGLFVIAAVGVLTAVVRFCPLNSLIGRNSCRAS
jgi:hypothetical protein